MRKHTGSSTLPGSPETVVTTRFLLLIPVWITKIVRLIYDKKTQPLASKTLSSGAERLECMKIATKPDKKRHFISSSHWS